MAVPLTELQTRAELPLLISFVDLSRFAAVARKRADREIADTLDEFYGRVYASVIGAGGHAVKFMGDAALLIFPDDAVDSAVMALLALKLETDSSLRSRGFPAWLAVKVHYGKAFAGPFGPPEHRSFDLIGQAVNIAAMLEPRGFVLSTQAFRKLAPETRRQFKRHTPLAVYVPVNDGRGPE